ncbi:DUF2922 domain-containing protein [Tepidibacter formicigenes]|jgi:hypothetical protein|uniref:DUF2922 domain-containing protein n=1 Tax=Tepidibacter formicigenes DSM 15518 TaxID=1123349 RepID=A0A1M6UFB7_9FIRM|nr:DUF2922 domain-containing protein [Tepidibacter formicigenes]SHK67859.1 Protein of unknown function [Tepidibacter formicigenes DSM 15518]
MSKKLLMTFENALGKKVSISIDDPKDDITSEEVKTVMDDIITKNIFTSNGGDFKKADSAKIVETDVTEFEYNE